MGTAIAFPILHGYIIVVFNENVEHDLHLKMNDICTASVFSERESASSACYVNLNHARKSVENKALFLLFAYFFFFYRKKEEKVRELFLNKKFF